MSKNTEKYKLLDNNQDYIRTHTRREICEYFNLDYNCVNNYCRKI